MPKQTKRTTKTRDALTAALLAEMLAQPRRPPVKRTGKAPPSTRRPRGTQ